MLSKTYIRKRLRRQRRIRAALKLLIIAAVIWLTILLSGAKPKIVRYEYMSGTSLWDLSRDCPETVDKRDCIAEIMAINAMTGSTVYANRLYMVPIYEGGIGGEYENY